MSGDRQQVPQWPRWAGWIGLIVLGLLLLPAVREFYIVEGRRWLYIFLVSSSLAFSLTPFLIDMGIRWGLVDQPSARKIHERPVPRIGGVAVYIGFTFAIVANAILEGWMVAVLFAGSVLLVIGLVDDAKGLPAWLRLGAQLGTAALVIASGVKLTLLPSGFVGDAINVGLTVLWIVGITNAFNFFDGMDGLASGLAMLMAFFMGVVAYETDQAGLAWLAVGMVGGSLGFFFYNFRVQKGPALIFLGDGGATFMGFTLACLAVKGNWADDNPLVSFSNPLLIFGLLIYDMIHITVERIVTGKVHTVKEWIDYVGKDHLHHRLERVLGSRRVSVEVIFALAICLGLAAIVLRGADLRDAVLLLAQAALIVIIVTIMEQRVRNANQEGGKAE